METSINRSSPVPLYHQIAEILRYRIATARLRPGDNLPPVREAAEIWKVNLHTVRRAYRELAEAGIVEIRPPHAARVTAPARSEVSHGKRLDQFLNSIVQRAASDHDLSPQALANLLVDGSTAGPSHRGPAHVVECSEIQAAGHAREIESRWQIVARPWSLERPDEPPSGAIVATYFHYNDVRVRWPHRLADVHFAGIRPDPTLARRIPVPRNDRRRTLRVCELDLPIAESVAADLSLILPDDTYRIVAEVVGNPGKRLARNDRGPLLFPPRVWNRLTEVERALDRAIEVRYVFEPDELEAIGRRFSWRRKQS